MDAGLSIAASGIAAATTEIDVTSQNIANAQTAGYVEQAPQLSEEPGGGVAVTSIAQINDTLLGANNLQAQGALSNLSSLQQVLTGIEDVFPLGQSSTTSTSTSGSTNTSIAGQLANFWSAWDGITQDPSGSAPRTEVVDLAQGLVTSLNEASAQLSQLASNTTSEDLSNTVSQVNALLSQAGSLNQSIVATSGAGANTNALEDQMNAVTSQLASEAGVGVTTEQNGTATITIGGVAVVQGDTVSPLALTTSSSGASITTSNGEVTVPVTSGTMAGLLSGINVSIPTYVQSLNEVANALATTVNNQLATGVTASDASGSGFPLFTSNGGTSTPTSVSAATITINSAVADDPSNIAAASASDTPSAAANDGSNAAAMAELGSLSNGPDSAYQQLIQNIGSDTQNVNSQVTSQTSVANEAQQALQSATGVNTNTELTNLMQFQNAYQASAKLVSVIDATIQSLLEAI